MTECTTPPAPDCGLLPTEERDRLVVEYLPLVRHVVGRLTITLPQGLDRDDLYGVGVLGLMNAARTWNPARGASFKTHAYTNVRGMVLDELRRHDIVPRSRRDRIRKLEAASTRLVEELGREPTVDELAAALELSTEQVEEVLLQDHTVRVLSLDAPRGDGSARAVAPEDRSALGLDPSEVAERRELKEHVKAAIRSLSESQRSVILLYYSEGLLLREIGAVLGITESRVCQIHAAALARLRAAVRHAEPTEAKP